MSGSLSVTWNNFKTAYNGVKKFAEVMPELVLGTSSETLGNALKTTEGSIFKKAQMGWEKLYEEGKGDFFKKFATNFKEFIPSIRSSMKDCAKEAVNAGKSSTIGSIKGLFKGLGKKMPFIASISMILFELPNIFTATKEKGIFQGGAEVIKSTAKLTSASIGAAIGSAFIPIPFVGSMVGWIAGEWLAGKIVGESYSVQKAEKEEILKEQQESSQIKNENQQYTQNQDTVNPYWIQNSQAAQIQNNNGVSQYSPSMQGLTPQFNGMYNPFAMQNIPYSDDIMAPQYLNQFSAQA